MPLTKEDDRKIDKWLENRITPVLWLVVGLVLPLVGPVCVVMALWRWWVIRRWLGAWQAGDADKKAQLANVQRLYLVCAGVLTLVWVAVGLFVVVALLMRSSAPG